MEHAVEIEPPDLFAIISIDALGRNEDLLVTYDKFSHHDDGYFRFIAVGIVCDTFESGSEDDFAYLDKIQAWLDALSDRSRKRMRTRAGRHLAEMKRAFARYREPLRESWEQHTLIYMRRWFGHALTLLRICGLGSKLVLEVQQFDADVKTVIPDWPF